MGCRILGEQAAGTVWGIQGDVTLTITPNGTFEYVPETGTLGDPPLYSNLIEWMETTGADAANQTIAKSSTQYGQQYDGVACQRFMRIHLETAQPYRNAEIAIRDGYINNYLINNNYLPQGHLWYPNGLYHNYIDHGHAASLTALQEVPDSSNWSYNEDDLRRHQVFNREIAYAMYGLIKLEKAVGVGNANISAAGKNLEQRYPFLITCMENHIYQWRYNDYSDPSYTPSGGRSEEFMKPFMVAITCMALAEYYDHNENVRGNGNLHWPTDHFNNIPEAILSMLVWMMDFATVPEGNFVGERIYREGSDGGVPEGAGTFYYIDRDSSGRGSTGSVARDLNMIIAAPYAWLGKHYGSSAIITQRADALFHGGAYILGNISPSIGSGLDNKHFNQQLYWMNEFFNWRGQV